VNFIDDGVYAIKTFIPSFRFTAINPITIDQRALTIA